MNVMITGAAGFVGGFLSRYCVQTGCSVLGCGVQEEPGDLWRSLNATYERCDIRNEPRMLELITKFRPDRIFHLAAQSYPTVSMDQPRETMDINAGGTINLYECLRASGVPAKVVIACSSAEYGPVAAHEIPVRETHALAPVHPYGVSKVAQDLLAAQYFANYGIPSIRIRIFNTTGPGKLADVCSDLTKRAIEIELGMRRPTMNVGSTEKRRAIADVRDLVSALWVSADRCEVGEVYNVGGNQIYSIQEIIDVIRANMKVSFGLEQDPSLMRACDEPVIAGDITKFQSCTGWKPEIDLTKTVTDMLDWWRARLKTSEHKPEEVQVH